MPLKWYVLIRCYQELLIIFVASDTFKKLASRLSVQVNSSTSTTLDSIYSRLNLSLVRSNARAFLARAGPRAKVSDLYLDS